MIKKEFVKRMYYFVMILFVTLIISLGIYFYILISAEINSLRIAINLIESTIIENGILESVNLSLTKITYLAIIQIVTFIVIILSLILIVLYLLNIYAIQRRNALVDELTQIYNRRAILFVLKREIKRAERYNHKVSIAICDIDYFKQYNDKNGHIKGDEALKKYAKILRKTSREIDFIGRIGGEEFLIVLPETKLSDAKIICERIRRKVEISKFNGEKYITNGALTTSIGTAEFNPGKYKSFTYSTKIKKLIDEADKKLYEIKNKNKNAVL